jgi:hypothetical protein
MWNITASMAGAFIVGIIWGVGVVKVWHDAQFALISSAPLPANIIVVVNDKSSSVFCIGIVSLRNFVI